MDQWGRQFQGHVPPSDPSGGSIFHPQAQMPPFGSGGWARLPSAHSIQQPVPGTQFQVPGTQNPFLGIQTPAGPLFQQHMMSHPLPASPTTPQGQSVRAQGLGSEEQRVASAGGRNVSNVPAQVAYLSLYRFCRRFLTISVQLNCCSTDCLLLVLLLYVPVHEGHGSNFCLM